MDDIDKLRDDLQSTKQMLALELRNKEAQDRENKRLQAKIQALEAELEKSKSSPAQGGASSTAPVDDALVKTLKKEAEEAQKTSKALEKKYQDVAEQLDTSKLEIEEQKRKIANLEKQISQGGVSLTVHFMALPFSKQISLLHYLYLKLIILIFTSIIMVTVIR